MKRQPWIMVFLLVLPVLVSCTASPAAPANGLIPTLNPIFTNSDAITAAATQDYLSVLPTPTITPTATVSPTQDATLLATQNATPGAVDALANSLATPVHQQSVLDLAKNKVPIFMGQLSPEWQVFTPRGMDYKIGSNTVMHDKHPSIEVQPSMPQSKLYVTLNAAAQAAYPRSDVVAVDFWLYSGDKSLSLFDLAVTAIGSNDYSYYIPSDFSGESEKPYEETYLVYLGFNRDIPPQTWVEVTIWLDQMQYDPHYQYVTGFYIKNRFNFLRSFAIADASLIMSDQFTPMPAVSLKDATATPIPTKTLIPSLTPLPTITGTPPTPTDTRIPTRTPTITPTLIPTSTMRPTSTHLPTLTSTP